MAENYDTQCNARSGHYHYRFVLWLSRDKLAIITKTILYIYVNSKLLLVIGTCTFSMVQGLRLTQ